MPKIVFRSPVLVDKKNSFLSISSYNNKHSVDKSCQIRYRTNPHQKRFGYNSCDHKSTPKKIVNNMKDDIKQRYSVNETENQSFINDGNAYKFFPKKSVLFDFQRMYKGE